MRASLLAAMSYLTKDSLGPKRWRYAVKCNITAALHAVHYALPYGMRLCYVTACESRARTWRLTHTHRDRETGKQIILKFPKKGPFIVLPGSLYRILN